jgi:hypothetical protein
VNFLIAEGYSPLDVLNSNESKAERKAEIVKIEKCDVSWVTTNAGIYPSAEVVLYNSSDRITNCSVKVYFTNSDGVISSDPISLAKIPPKSKTKKTLQGWAGYTDWYPIGKMERGLLKPWSYVAYINVEYGGEVKIAEGTISTEIQ